MKKYLFMLLAAVAMICTSAVLTSCGDDDDDSNSALVGAWTYTNSISISGTTFKDVYTVEFTSTGKYTWKLENENGTGIEYGSYTYNPSSKLLVLTPNGDEDVRNYVVSELTDTKLTFSNYSFTKK